jgi:hypothetical protein
MISIAELIPVLQTAIGPVILISGIGLLLLSMTNRLSRVIDRARNLLALSETLQGPPKDKTKAQIDILWEQARLIRRSILFGAISVLCAALLIIAVYHCAFRFGRRVADQHHLYCWHAFFDRVAAFLYSGYKPVAFCIQGGIVRIRQTCRAGYKGKEKMNFLQKLFGGSSSPKPEKRFYTFTVKCKRCGELIVGRIDLDNDLSVEYDENGGEMYRVRKVLMGENRCFQRVEAMFEFTPKRILIEQQIVGGEFVQNG